MTTIKTVFAVSMAMIVTACATAPPVPVAVETSVPADTCAPPRIEHNPLVGRWYYVSREGWLPIAWSILELRSDGSFSATVRQSGKDRITIGRWSYSNGLLALLSEFENGAAIDPTDEKSRFIEFIESVDARQFTHKVITYKDKDDVRRREIRWERIGDDFKPIELP